MGTAFWIFALMIPAFFDKSAILSGVRVAQSTNVTTCIPENLWMNNVKGQNPCLIAAWLWSPCLEDPTTSRVAGYPGTGWYYTLPIPQATDCTCSTVVYSIMQACSLCQGASYSSWSVWVDSCGFDVRHEGEYPRPIPNSTSIPHWAYLDVITFDTFNITLARADSMQDLPESTAISSTTATSPSSSSASAPASTNTSSSPPSTNGPAAVPSGSHVETASIVGGVVGGIGGAAILCAAAFLVRSYLRQKGRAQVAPVPALTDQDMLSTYAESSNIKSPSPALPGLNRAGVGAGYVPDDPNDPNTFPVGRQFTPTSPSYNHRLQYRPEPGSGSTVYSGVAEV
ncbi:hypothetical protein EIP91_000545 [Steccherinum ochraceum]|uniref:Transmembrane protein n=1 Tax=Steccherinum ochraceum TaxID=92696 RepID=A0A4R0RT16_9APHY|nr:hypothetical protein EIP91_000545 [Steccherinum ochraceum]